MKPALKPPSTLCCSEVMKEAVEAGLPDIAVDAMVGRMLTMLTSMTRGRLAIEVGTLAGYSGVWIARGLSDGGRLITIELDPAHAAFAARQFEKAGVADRVEFLGRRDDIRALLARMSIGVICSDSEGFSNAIIEYMLSGLPVVAAATGGNPEAIEDGVTGLLVEPGDAGALAAAIEEVVSGRLDYGGLSAAALARHRERFSAEAMAGRVAEVYSEVLGGQSA